VKYEGRTFDCGSKLGFLLSNLAYALDRPDLGKTFASKSGLVSVRESREGADSMAVRDTKVGFVAAKTETIPGLIESYPRPPSAV